MEIEMYFTKEQADALHIGGEGWYCYDPEKFKKVEIERQDDKNIVYFVFDRKRKSKTE